MADSKEEKENRKEYYCAMITGSNRGLGLEFCGQLLESNEFTVIACCRNPQQANDLLLLQNKYNKNRLIIEKLDVISINDINNLGNKYLNKPIDLLILNAGVPGANHSNDISESIFEFEQNDLLNTFNVNTIGPLLITQKFYKNVILSKRKQVIGISSGWASIGDNESGGSVSYRISKVGLNMGLQEFRIKGEKDGVHVMLLAPGWVKTRMGTNKARLTPKESVKMMLENVINDYKNKKSGGFYLYNGKEFPW